MKRGKGERDMPRDMERTKLKAARIERGLSQPELAHEIKGSREAISQWELGKADPHPDSLVALCLFFGKHPADLDLAKALTESELAMLQDILKNKTIDRRQALALLATPAFAGLDLSSLVQQTALVSTEQFLSQCRAALRACWQLLSHGEYHSIEVLLHENMPTLVQLANTQGEHQKVAAGLALQAKILHIQHATRNLDFAARETHCLEAVRFGHITGLPTALAVAQYWQGDTYTYCYRQPKTAIALFNQALAGLSSEANLSKSAIYSDLSIAYAQDSNETQAREYAEMARNTMPRHPEREPFHMYLHSHATLYDLEGKMYLSLAEHFPKSDYAEKAYATFDLSLDEQAITKSRRGQVLIRKADAACAIGDLHEYLTCLKQGTDIAWSIHNPHRQRQALTTLHNAPAAWKKEPEYQKLTAMF